METGRKQRKRLPLMRLKYVLMVLFFLIGGIPLFIQSAVLTNSFRQNMIESRKADIQNRSLILATKLSRAGYFKGSSSQEETLNTEMDAIAQSYSGRVILVDRDYRIIRDSFHLAEGRYHVAPEVIRGFRGESRTSYNSGKCYVVQTMPVYDSVEVEAEEEERPVSGVLLFISSTEMQRKELKSTGNTLLILNAALFIAILTAGAMIVRRVLQPFYELKNSLRKVASGDLDQNVPQGSYVMTAELSEAINETLRRLKTLDRSREEFVSNVSHELKTPITSIRVLADSLMSMEDAPIEMYKDFMNDISQEIDREAKIIDDLLSLVRMDRSSFVLNRKATDMHEMLEQILKRLRPLARVNNIELILETVRETTADVDEVKFSLAIMNLVENGIKYNVKDGWVKVNLDADHQFCYIRVEDGGIGIPESRQEQVFERFYRVDKARSRETGGTGLGLAITREIVLMHHGIIRVSSKEGEGSSFLVRIPLNYIEKSGRNAAADRKEKGGERPGENREAAE